MSFDDSDKNSLRAKRVVVAEMAGSTSVNIDVLPGDSFGQIAEKVRSSLNKSSPVTIFHKSGSPFPPDQEAYDSVDDKEQLLYSVANIGG